MTRPTAPADRCAGALRRRPAGACAAARRQRGHASRPRGGRRRLRLWRSGACASCCAPSRATTSTGLRKTIALAEPILAGLGFGGGRVATIETDDPDALGEALRAIAPLAAAPRPASFAPVGGKRDVMRLALRELQRAAPAPVDVVALPAGAPFGAVEINVEGCTLCLACVSACPTGALGRHRAADAALRRGRLRAMRAVQGDLSGEGHHPAPAARLPRRHRRRRAC